MCYRPLHIRATKNGYIAHDIPCGKCEECLQQKRDSYVIRAYQDFINYGQRAVFCTLTYSDEYLPTYAYYRPVFMSVADVAPSKRLDYIFSYDFHCEPLNEPSSVTCWNKRHVQRFLKRLNEYLFTYIANQRGVQQTYVTSDGKRRKTIEFRELCKLVGRPLRYLVTCERGKSDIYIDSHGRTRQGTSRPHYHVILILTNSCPELESLSSDFLLELVSKNWKYGLTYNEVIGRQGNPQKAIEYVCKYVTKSITDNLIEGFYSKEDELSYKPFTLISNNFGSSWLDKNNFTSVDSILNILDSGIQLPNSSGDNRSINPPAYYINKLLIQYTKVHVTNPAENRTIFETIISFPKLSDSLIWGEHCFIDIKSNTCDTWIETNPTPIGQLVRDEVRCKSVDFYLHTLDVLCSIHPVELDIVPSSVFSPGVFTPDVESAYHRLCSVERNSLYYYLLFERNISIDPLKLTSSDPRQELEFVFFIIRSYLIYHRNQIRLKHDLDFHLQLRKAFETSPELFNKYPIL